MSIEPEPSTTSVKPRVFLSYSWDSEDHKAWVRAFAERLRNDGIVAVLDQWHVQLGDRLPQFMETSVRDSDFVLVICTVGYKERFDGRKGGVGYEGHVITGELMSLVGVGKFIPVLRKGDWVTGVPSALSGIAGVDLRADSEPEYQKLLLRLHNVEVPVPSIREVPAWLDEPPEASHERRPTVRATASPSDGAGNRDLQSAYYREIQLWPTTQLDKSPAVLWESAVSSILDEVPWPLGLYWYRTTGGDRFVKREINQIGFQLNYEQHDALIDRYEHLSASDTGRITIRETQEFPNRHRGGGFPYDTVIATTADLLEFAARFFRCLALPDVSEIGVSISWHGLRGRFIAADTVKLTSPDRYRQKRAECYGVHSPVVKFRLMDHDGMLADHIEKLLAVVFSQFDMFRPLPEVYRQVLDQWKSLSSR